MNIKRSYAVLIGVFTVVTTVLFLDLSLVFAETCQIVRISEEKGAGGTRLEINPQKITVSTDTCVVWMNWVRVAPVSISFREKAKQCEVSTISAGFSLKTGEECFIAEKLTRGATASMYFKKPGVYKYQLEIPGKTTGVEGPSDVKIVAEGVIEVK